MITKETIDKIFSTIRVEEIIGEYVQLKRAGSNFKGLSPFHEEKSPSFVVSPSKQIWKDFSSGKGGTAISFLMEIENFTYPEALRHAAKKYGIEIKEDVKEYSEEQIQAQTERDILYKIHEIANDFFQTQLWESEEGQMIAYSYFKERELRDDIIKKFQLGYSPEKKNAFTEFALDKAYSKEILEKSGLSIFPENTPSGIDRFRDRVVFPIHSFSGRVLGFGARILKNNVKTAKYLNSPETEIYHKSNVLYGLNQGKQAISRKNLCLLVEGYMDVVSLHQSGIENVVASSGTSLTTEQIKLIKRLTENVTILFDGDNAGIKASFRSIDMLLSEGMNIRVLLFPDGDDPDSFARKHPQDFVENFIDKEAKDFIDFKAEILLKEANDDPIKKAEAIRDIVKSVAFVKNDLKREVYLKEVSNKFGLSEQSLFNELDIHRQVQGNLPNVEKKSQTKSLGIVISNDEDIQTTDSLLTQEEALVKLMLKYGDQIIDFPLNLETKETIKVTIIEAICNHIKEDEIIVFNPVLKKILDEITNGLSKNELRKSDFFLTFYDEELINKTTYLIADKYFTSKWAKHNIYFSSLEENNDLEVFETVLRHKAEFARTLIHNEQETLKTIDEDDDSKYYEVLRNIVTLKSLINYYNKFLHRIL